MEYVYFACAVVYGVWISYLAIRSRIAAQTIAESLSVAIKALGRANRSLDSACNMNGKLRDMLVKAEQFIEEVKQDNIRLRQQMDGKQHESTKDIIQRTYDLMKLTKESA